MNIFKSACLSRFGRVPWSSPCPHCDSVKVPVTPVPTRTQTEQSKLSVRSINIFQRKTCYKSLSLTSRPALFTQVRYSKYPRLHRDLEFPNFNEYRKDPYVDVRDTSWGQGDEKHGITYTMGIFFGMAGMYAAKSVCTYMVSSMSASADVLALANVEVDLAKVAPGACDIVKWRGKPLFIKHRTQADIDSEKDTPLSTLRDPEAPDARAPNPQWLIVIGICTHLGCVPIANTGDFAGGYYCPCHGSHYDNLGRIRKGPAPTNLVVPPYKFLTDTTVLVG